MAVWITLARLDNPGDKVAVAARSRAAVMFDCFVRVAIVPGTPKSFVEAVIGPGVETGSSYEGALVPGCFQRDVQYWRGRLRIAYTLDERWNECVRHAYFR